MSNKSDSESDGLDGLLTERGETDSEPPAPAHQPPAKTAPAALPAARLNPSPQPVRLHPAVQTAYDRTQTTDGRILLLLRVGMTPGEIATVMGVLPSMIYARISDPQRGAPLRAAQMAAQDMLHDMAVESLRTEGLKAAAQALIDIVKDAEATNTDKVKAASAISAMLEAADKRKQSQAHTQRVTVAFEDGRGVAVETTKG